MQMRWFVSLPNSFLVTSEKSIYSYYRKKFIEYQFKLKFWRNISASIWMLCMVNSKRSRDWVVFVGIPYWGDHITRSNNLNPSPSGGGGYSLGFLFQQEMKQSSLPKTAIIARCHPSLSFSRIFVSSFADVLLYRRPELLVVYMTTGDLAPDEVIIRSLKEYWTAVASFLL